MLIDPGGPYTNPPAHDAPQVERFDYKGLAQVIESGMSPHDVCGFGDESECEQQDALNQCGHCQDKAIVAALNSAATLEAEKQQLEDENRRLRSGVK